MGIGGPGLEKSFSKYSPKYDRLLFGPSNLEAEETHDFRNAKFASELLMKGTATMVDLRGKERTVRFWRSGRWASARMWLSSLKILKSA